MEAQADGIGTRQVVLDLIIEKGPIMTSTLANVLKLTPAAVRRHLIYLEDTGKIKNLEPTNAAACGRGRPARDYVATDTGRTTQPGEYSQMATKALGYLQQFGGDDAIEDFAHHHSCEVERRCAPMIHTMGEDPGTRVTALADALAQDGYVAAVRHTRNGIALQICQGSCPVQDVTKNLPKLYEAETEAFSRLLDIHVQRLAALAGGDHACTTSVPLLGQTPSLVSQVGVATRARARQKGKGE